MPGRKGLALALALRPGADLGDTDAQTRVNPKFCLALAFVKNSLIGFSCSVSFASLATPPPS